MSRKIQFHTFHLLFRLFSYLADKSGGWSMFVRPKLVIGGVIVGLGVTACRNNIQRESAQNSNEQKRDSTSERLIINDPEDTSTTTCYVSVPNNDYEGKDNEPFYIAEQMPEFPDGNMAMFKYIDRYITYPKEAIKHKVSGMVICTFVVGKDGLISDIKVVRGLHPLLDKEAVRIIKTFPKWKPGMQGGKAVPVKFTLPIRFTLPKK